MAQPREAMNHSEAFARSPRPDGQWSPQVVSARPEGELTNCRRLVVARVDDPRQSISRETNGPKKCARLIAFAKRCGHSPLPESGMKDDRLDVLFFDAGQKQSVVNIFSGGGHHPFVQCPIDPKLSRLPG